MGLCLTSNKTLELINFLTKIYSSSQSLDYKKIKSIMNNIDVGTYEELAKIIDNKTGNLQNIHLELENLNLQFDLQLEWIDSLLRDKAIEENNNTLSSIEDMIFDLIK